MDLFVDIDVLATGVLAVAGDAPAEACLDEATTADLPPLPAGFNTGLLLDVLAPELLGCLGVAGNFRRSFGGLTLSVLLLVSCPTDCDFELAIGFCGGGVGVEVIEEVTDDLCDCDWEDDEVEMVDLVSKVVSLSSVVLIKLPPESN